MNFSKDNIIKEAKPKFCSVQLEPCIPQSNQTRILPHAHKRNMPYESHQISKRNKIAKWPVVVAKPEPINGFQKGTVLINDEPFIVSSRIEESLRVRSVKAEFDTNLAEATCTTNDYLEYKIYLYACPDDDKSTYVEVMIMGGCRFQFLKEREAIVNAAKGLRVVDATSKFPPKLTIPSSMKDLYVPPTTNELENLLDRAMNQLHSSDRSTTLFVLQNLAFMTNSKKAHSETAHELSRLVMKSKSDILDMIVSIYASETSNTKGKMSDQICDACLCIVANGIDSLPKNEGFLDQECEYCIKNLTPYLIHNLERLECVHHACLVLRCLSLLVDNSSLACSIVQSTNVCSFMEQAAELGREEHYLLEKTAMSTIDVFQRKMIVV